MDPSSNQNQTGLAQPGFDEAQLRGWVEQQTALGPRRPGSPAGRANEDWLRDQLLAFGLSEVRQEAIPITRADANSWSLRVGSGDELEELDCFPIPYTRHTAAAGVTGPLVFAERRRLWHHADWRGAMVVAEIGFPPLNVGLLQRLASGRYDPEGTLPAVDHPATWVRLGWHLYRLAARRGAAAFIGIVADQPGGSCRMFAPYGFKEEDILDKPLPGVWVGRGEGERLRALARRGDGRAQLTVTGVHEPGLTHNVVGEIPGSSQEAIVLSCHHDSPFASPVEDASGVAVVLAVAQHFAASRDLRRRLIVLLSAGHFYGSIGTRSFIERHRSDLLQQVACEISIEHIAREAVEDANGRLVPSGQPEATGIFVPFSRAVDAAVIGAMRDHDLRRVLTLPAEGPLGPYPPTDGGDWWAAGVPVINSIANPVYLLTDDDGPQWVDGQRLPKTAAAFADVIRRLDAMDRRTIAAVDSKARLLAMKALRRIVHAKTTLFGLRPVH